MKTKKIQEHYGGRIKSLVEMVAELVARNPHLAEDKTLLHATIKANTDGYGVRETCFNCKRSMKITTYTADLLDGLLILAMAREVKNNLSTGIQFTEANKVHLPTLETTQGILKRNTKCDYLGLIKQPKNWRGSGYWVLTGWAWKALKGDEIPKSAKYWEGHMIGRSEEMTTLTEMFKTHGDIVDRAIRLRKHVRSDYRTNFKEYSPSDWSEFGGYVEQQELL